MPYLPLSNTRALGVRIKSASNWCLGVLLPLLFCCALVAQDSRPTVWKSVKIGGGGFVSGLLFHPSKRNLAYARTDVGGIYRWDAGIQKWTALNDDIGGLNNEFMRLGILSFAVDPNDSSLIYAVGGQYVEWWASTAVFLSSKDRGATWTRSTYSFRVGGNQDGRNTGERLAVDPNDGRILFLGTTQDGLWRSADRGVTWARVSGFSPSSCTLVLFDKSSGSSGAASQTIFVGVNSTTGSSLYRSTDGGNSWSAVAGQPSGVMPHRADISYAAPRSLYISYSNALGPNGVTAGSVWKLELDAGLWSNISPSSGGYGFGGLSLDASSPGTVVVSTLDKWNGGDAIYRSTNGGASWSELLMAGSLDHTKSAFKTGLSPHWIGDIKIDPFTPGRAMFVTGYGIYATDQLASSNTPVWHFFNEGLEESVPMGIVSPSSGAPLVSVIGDFGGFRHDDLDLLPLRFDIQNGTNPSIDFAELVPSFIVRATNTSTRGAYSSDGGTTWTAFATSSVTSAYGGKIAVNCDATRILWAQEGNIAYYSTDRGSTWTAATGAPSGQAPVTDRVNPSKAYLYHGSGSRVYVSQDGGASYAAAAAVPSNGSGMRAVPGFEGHLWLPCWSNGLQRSTNGGASFTRLSSLQEGYAVGFGKAAEGQSYPAIYIWGKVNNIVGIFRSTDEGASWVRINDDLHQYGYINLITGDPRVYGRVYVAGSGRGIVYGTLETPSAPVIDAQPQSLTLTIGSTATFKVTASGSAPLSYQWSKNGLVIPGATGAKLSITNAQNSNAGDYSVTVTNALGSATSNAASLSFGEAMITALSVRAQTGINRTTLILGIIFSGEGSKHTIIRALGPALSEALGANYLRDPNLTLYSGESKVMENDNWVDSDSLRTRFASIGMGPLPQGSKDAVLVQALSANLYTVHIGSQDGSSGVAMAEVYDAERDQKARRLSAVAVSNFVGTDERILIAGVIIEGNASKQLLIRGLGPELQSFYGASVLADPLLRLHKFIDPTRSDLLGENDNWQDDANVGPALASKGFTPLPNGSKDAALWVTLSPGLYTVSLLGKNNGTGIGQIDIYEAN